MNTTGKKICSDQTLNYRDRVQGNNILELSRSALGGIGIKQ